jgi:hypothetical protein
MTETGNDREGHDFSRAEELLKKIGLQPLRAGTPAP